MGAEHSQYAAPPSAPLKPSSVSWRALQLGFRYAPTDLAVWPQCVPLLQWLTADDAVELHERLQRRLRPPVLSVRDFRDWILDGDSDRRPCPRSNQQAVDIMTPPSLRQSLRDADASLASMASPPPPFATFNGHPQQQQPQQHQAAVPMIDAFLEHVFRTFAGDARALYAMEFLAAMVIGSRAIWDVEHKCRVLLALFQHRAKSRSHDTDPLFGEAELTALFLCAMRGVAKLTIGMETLWQRQRLDVPRTARALALECLRFVEQSRGPEHHVDGRHLQQTLISATEFHAFWRATPVLRRFLSLFSGEELRNPFTFGVLRSPSDGLSLPSRYRPLVDQQRRLYDAMLQTRVTFEGRQQRRRENAATLIQSTWRRRCSQAQLDSRRRAVQHQRHASAATLQQFLRSVQVARLLELHAEAEVHAFNGALYVAGLGPCVPSVSASRKSDDRRCRSGPRGVDVERAAVTPAPLHLVDAFKLLGVKVVAVAVSRTCALAVPSDRETLFAWGRCLPRRYEGSEGEVTLTESTPRRLAHRFSASPVAELACGLSHALVLTRDGNVHSWGFNDHGQLGHGSDATLAARSNGAARYAWHYDERDGRESPLLADPTPLAYFAGAPTQQADPIAVRSVVCGDYYSLALGVEGDVFSWGEGSEGQLGHGDAHERFQVAFVDRHMLNSAFTFLAEPEPVLALARDVVRQVACRKNHSVALTEDGRVFAWGNWGKRCGHDREHAFTPEVVVDAALAAQLELRQVSVGDHHMLAEGSSVWLTVPPRDDGLGRDRRICLALARGWSCGLDGVRALFGDGTRRHTCVVVDCDVDDLEETEEEGEEEEEAEAEQQAQAEREGLKDGGTIDRRNVLWRKRVAAYRLQDASQVALFDARLAHVLACFPRLGQRPDGLDFERLLAQWFHGHVSDRVVLMPRGKPAGVYMQLLLPSPDSPAGSASASASTASPPMIEFPVCCARGSTAVPSKRGFATHVFHDVMRERLQALSARQRQAIPMTYMEPNALVLLEFDERCCTAEHADVMTRTATPDGRVSVTWSEAVLDEMTRRVLAAQEAGALAVLIVLDLLGADPFELDVGADAGVYIPVLMVSKATLASRVAVVPSQQRGTATSLHEGEQQQRSVTTFGDVLSQFLASQALEEDEDDPRAVPPLPLAWVARCFRRVDTTAVRVDSAFAHGATGVVFVQDEQSLEVDGETRGAPIFLSPPLASKHWASGAAFALRRQQSNDRLIAMVSSSDGALLRAASYLSVADRAMPFVSDVDDDGHEDGSPCELLVDVTVEVRPGGMTYAWGNGQNGRLGLGNPELEPFRDGYEALTDTAYRFIATPTPVVALVGHEMTQLVSGSAHNVAVTTEGRVFTWGKGNKGELGASRT
ncbi:hypothetical protein P43SY_003950 [Pythium insidiosum]|uniref:Regulator of chromosome condensation (RCC1)-like protein n=1 Tax=Pythium insidiosum TaxID=114742 RepID=A0AAD5QA97_PYTIN|nr:hypothetical protein P43SY_003950 [Pythium insidiosum]